MKIRPFELERYFAKYEFSVKYLLSSSDCDGLSMKELAAGADEELRQMWENLHLGYTESLGLPLLREEAAKLYQGITDSEVLVAAPEEGIFLAINALINKGDHAVVTYPGYQSLYEIAQAEGAEVTKWRPEEEKGWRFDPQFLKDNIRENTKLIVVNFPHNPTGYLASREDFEAIIDMARERGIYVLSDEMYRYLEHEEGARLPAAAEIYDRAVSLFGVSKTLGMAGARIGWVVTKDKELYSRMANFKDYTTICSSAPSEILAVMALRQREKIVAKHLERIKRNLGLAEEFFGRQGEKFSWTAPRAGTIGFPRIEMETGVLALAEKLVAETGVMILPSTVYGFDDRHFRLGLGRENFGEGLRAFEEWVEKMR